MYTVNQPLARFVWYADPLDLQQAFAWRDKIKRLYLINPNGTGHVSFTPASPINAVRYLTYGVVIELVSHGVDPTKADTFYLIDNGQAYMGQRQLRLQNIYTAVGDGNTTRFSWEHNLGATPAGFQVEGNEHVGGIASRTADDTHLTVRTALAPPAGALLSFTYSVSQYE